MGRLEKLFQRTRAEGRAAVIAYVTVGFPTKDATPGVVKALVEAGADAIELGIPFSDPIGDGPTVQAASQRALDLGVTPAFCLEAAQECRTVVDCPLVFMTYYNPIVRNGLANFCQQAAAAGVDGLIVPDLPADEGDDLEAACRPIGVDTIYLLAPTSTADRIHTIANHATGFVYLVSLTGVTGARTTLAEGIPEMAHQVRAATDLPICIGFGISTPEHVRALANIADGVVVGSKVLNLLNEANGLTKAADFIRSLREAAARPTPLPLPV